MLFRALVAFGVLAPALLAQNAGSTTISEVAGKRVNVGGRPGETRLSNSPSRQRTVPELTPKMAVARSAPASVTPLGSVGTPSPAESVAVYGNIAYVCDSNEISVVNISNPAALQLIGTLSNGLVQNSSDINCAIQRNTLVVFSDQNSSLVGNTPAFLAYSLSNPSSPQLIAATPVNKRFFGIPAYIGNNAFIPTWAQTFFGSTWDTQWGDLVSVDLTGFSSPSVVNTLEQPPSDPQLGGPTAVMGATQADTTLLYLGGSTSTKGPGECFGCGNTGSGRLQLVDVTVPNAMKLVGQLVIPGTKQLGAPLIQGTVGIAIGNNGGFSGQGIPNEFAGNVVVVAFDVSDRRQPTILSITTTNYKPATDGSGGVRIGNNLFAFPAVNDANGNPVLLVADVTNPQAPVISSIPFPQSIAGLQVVGSTLYAALGSGGFATYSIPGVSNTPPSTCPALVDTAVVLDLGTAMSAQAFADAKTALQSFINTLHLPADHVAVVSFTTSGVVNQHLTSNGFQADTALNNLVPGGISYIGAGIAAAQAELTGPGHTPAAFPVMIVLSDGVDRAAPNPNATAAAAASAQSAGIRLISLQYGSTPTAVMQAIASSPSDFHLIGQE